MTTTMITFAYTIPGNIRPTTEIRTRTELTPEHITSRLASAVEGMTDGTANAETTMAMSRALMDAYLANDLPVGPDAALLWAQLQILCTAATTG
ncbi:hypothetical protein [Nonomuraea sp. NPDC005650]|uniref:hypothetical protein n=1 Tax=Nonomuraea sp. NPDC005650 TaxID=3157045 RepID=UPI00339F2A97